MRNGRAGRPVAPRPAVAGPAARIAEEAGAWAAVGVDELIVPDFTLGTGQRRLDALDALLDAFRRR